MIGCTQTDIIPAEEIIWRMQEVQRLLDQVLVKPEKYPCYPDCPLMHDLQARMNDLRIALSQ